MGRGLVLLAALGATLASFAACADLSGLAGDGTVDAAVDAPSTGDATVDVSSDSSSSDALQERLADAGFCQGIDAEFCDDFERTSVDDPKLGWSSRLSSAADASVSVLPGQGLGGSRGLYVAVSEATASPAMGDFAYLGQNIGGNDPGANALIEVELDLRIATRAVDYLAVAAIVFPNAAGASGEIGVATYDTNKLSVTGAAAANAVGPATAWHHVIIAIERESNGATKRVLSIDGLVQASLTGEPTPASGGAQLRLGAFNPGAGTGTSGAVFDNVVIRRR